MHPIFHIKIMMIKRELEKNPELANENRDRFLPKYQKKNVKTNKVKIKEKKLHPSLILNNQARVGIENPTIEVQYENIIAEAYIGSRALPTVFNATINVFQGLLNSVTVLPSRKIELSILHDVSGIIKPGRNTNMLVITCILCE